MAVGQHQWKIVDDLTSTVLSQKETIEKLSSQLNFVLSYLDISGNVDGATNISNSNSSEVSEIGAVATSTVNNQQMAPSGPEVNTTPSYSDVVNAGSNVSLRSQPAANL